VAGLAALQVRPGAFGIELYLRAVAAVRQKYFCWQMCDVGFLRWGGSNSAHPTTSAPDPPCSQLRWAVR
jgi:hypothetical protein